MEDKIILSQAFSVESTTVSGCFRNQKIKQNIKSELLFNDTKKYLFKFHENNIEDIFIQNSIFLTFEIEKQNYLVIELIPTKNNPLNLDFIELIHYKNGYKLKSDFGEFNDEFIETKLYYSENPILVTSKITCPESSDFQPFSTKYLEIYPVEYRLEGNLISELFLEKFKEIQLSVKYFNSLEKALSVGFRNWEASKLSDEILKKLNFKIEIKKDIGKTLSNLKESFVPLISKKILIIDNGKEIGAKVNLGLK